MSIYEVFVTHALFVFFTVIFAIALTIGLMWAVGMLLITTIPYLPVMERFQQPGKHRLQRRTRIVLG